MRTSPICKLEALLTSSARSKLVTLVSSLFTSAYVFLWPQYFPNSPLQLDNLPIFDGRCVSSP